MARWFGRIVYLQKECLPSWLDGYCIDSTTGSPEYLKLYVTFSTYLLYDFAIEDKSFPCLKLSPGIAIAKVPVKLVGPNSIFCRKSISTFSNFFRLSLRFILPPRENWMRVLELKKEEI